MRIFVAWRGGRGCNESNGRRCGSKRSMGLVPDVLQLYECLLSVLWVVMEIRGDGQLKSVLEAKNERREELFGVRKLLGIRCKSIGSLEESSTTVMFAKSEYKYLQVI